MNEYIVEYFKEGVFKRFETLGEAMQEVQKAKNHDEPILLHEAKCILDLTKNARDRGLRMPVGE